MNKINADLKYLFLIWGVLFAAMFLTYAHHGNIIIDCGREVYYPVQILSGKILYKNIFNIYGPFSYMFNAFLFKIFSVNLNVLYLAGVICSFLITTLIYFIGCRFLSKFLSFSIAIFTIAVGVLNLNLFNFIFPYSYAMLYGIVAFFVSIFFLLKYQENPEKNLFLYISCFFAGLCVASKYEFLPYLFVLIYALIKIKPLKFKQYYFVIFSLLFIPVFCFGVLFLQGLRISDLLNTLSIIKKMAQTQTIKYFYISQGVYFTKGTIWFLISNFLLTLIPFSLLLFGFQQKKKVLSFFTVLLSIILLIFLVSPVTLAFLPVLILILSIINYKNFRTNYLLMLLTLSSITISLKAFCGLTTLNYGVFFVSFLLITGFALLIEKFNEKKIMLNQKAIGVYVLILAFVIGIQNLSSMLEKKYPVVSERGIIYTTKDLSISTQELLNYLKQNTKKSDKVVVFPEGPFINFLAGRKSDDYFNSLIPLYVETFGEECIIKHFKNTKTEYIIFNNWETKDYYFKYICTDYALSFCNFVSDNYIQENVIGNEFRYLIFKRKY